MGIQYEGFLWKFYDKIRKGVGAVVTQSYTEANVKNGVQFEFGSLETPTYSGGNAGAISNMNRINPVATTVSILTGVTVTADGTEIAAPTNGVGGVGQGNGTVGTYAVQGAERVLKPNTAYLLRITNRDTANPATVATYATWYEGYALRERLHNAY